MQTYLDTLAMKNDYTISNGAVTIFIHSKKYGKFEANCSQQDFDLVSRYTWRVVFKGHNKHPYTQTDTLRNSKRSTRDMRVRIMQPEEGFVSDHG
jgi:hypothetical protein